VLEVDGGGSEANISFAYLNFKAASLSLSLA
jgi:hypothetical protein